MTYKSRTYGLLGTGVAFALFAGWAAERGHTDFALSCIVSAGAFVFFALLSLGDRE